MAWVQVRHTGIMSASTTWLAHPLILLCSIGIALHNILVIYWQYIRGGYARGGREGMLTPTYRYMYIRLYVMVLR